MGLTLLNQLGEWNPQLFRELKGQLKRRNLFSLVASSLICQCLMLAALMDWQIRWQLAFRTLNWILPLLLLACGVYLLSNDLSKEESRGTLNFIRLSPQSSQSILLGKMLGVPALLYLAIASAVPLHWISAQGAGVPLGWFLGIYALWGVSCCLFYSAAALYALKCSAQSESKALAGVTSLLTCVFGFPLISTIDLSFDWYESGSGFGDWQWFLLPLGRHPELMLLWTLITLSVGTYWIWQAVNRFFRNPNATLVSKTQSYWLVATFHGWLLGFAIPQFNSVPSDFQFFIGFAVLFVLNPVGFLVLIGALTPCRQVLQDWARYRRSSSPHKSLLNSSLLKDLMWGEKSPALVAIAINLLLITVIWIPWILLRLSSADSTDNFTPQTALLGFLLTINVILIYAVIAHIVIFMKRLQQLFWAAGIVGTLIGLPLTVGILQGLEPLKITLLWLFSPLPILVVANTSATNIFLSFLGQLAILGLLTLQLTRQLKKAGESNSKSLFSSPSSLPIGEFK